MSYDPNNPYGGGTPQPYVPPTSGDWAYGGNESSPADEWRFDFNEAEETQYQSPLPGGTYNFFCTDVQVTRTKQGKPMAVLITIVDGGPMDGRTLIDRVIKPDKTTQTYDGYKKSLGFLRQRLSAYFGHPVLGDINIDPYSLKGKSCTAEVTLRNDPQYGPQNDIRAWYPRQNTTSSLPSAPVGPSPAMATQATPMVPPAQPQGAMFQPQATPPAPPSPPMSTPGLSEVTPDGTVRNVSPPDAHPAVQSDLPPSTVGNVQSAGQPVESTDAPSPGLIPQVASTDDEPPFTL